MVSFSIRSRSGKTFESLLGPDSRFGPDRQTLAESQSKPQDTASPSFKDPSQKLINYITARLDQRSISQIKAKVETSSGHLAEIILKLNLPTQPHIAILADLENRAALQESCIALKKLWPKAYADLPDKRAEKKLSIIFDFSSDYSTEADLRILNMQFNKMITENLAGFKKARITEVCLSNISCQEAEKLESLNRV